MAFISELEKETDYACAQEEYAVSPLNSPEDNHRLNEPDPVTIAVHVVRRLTSDLTYLDIQCSSRWAKTGWKVRPWAHLQPATASMSISKTRLIKLISSTSPHQHELFA